MLQVKQIFAATLLCHFFSVSQGSSERDNSGSNPFTCHVKEVSTGQTKSCIFPFSFNDRIFAACTNFTDPDELFWCSTLVDSEGVHVGKRLAWGHCDMTNPACRGITKILPTLPSLQIASAIPSATSISDQVSPSDDETKGTWKPNSKKGECGLRYTSENIVGGEFAQPGELPFMALIGYRIEGEVYFWCAGTPINKFYVLTAAHCQSKGRLIYNVVLGEYKIGDNPDCSRDESCLPPVQEVLVEKVQIHENWNLKTVRLGFDIALLRLAKPAILSFDSPRMSSVAPVCLPWNKDDPGHETSLVSRATVAGWGKSTNGFQETNKNYLEFRAATKVLRKAELPIVGESGCLQPFRVFNATTQICAGGEKGVDSCNGDSGGPLMFRQNHGPEKPWFQIGIVSYGTSLCGIEIPAVYTRLTNYLNWIEKNLEP